MTAPAASQTAFQPGDRVEFPTSSKRLEGTVLRSWGVRAVNLTILTDEGQTWVRTSGQEIVLVDRPENPVDALFAAVVAQDWDWSQARSTALPSLRQATYAAATEHITGQELGDVVRSYIGNERAVDVVLRQCLFLVKLLRDNGMVTP